MKHEIEKTYAEKFRRLTGKLDGQRTPAWLANFRQSIPPNRDSGMETVPEQGVPQFLEDRRIDDPPYGSVRKPENQD